MPSLDDASLSELLDQIQKHVFRAGLLLASARNLARPDGSAIAQIDHARAELDLIAAKIHTTGLSEVVAPDEMPFRARRLRRVESTFAYLRDGTDWVRVADGRLWAQESEHVLYSANGGRALARRDGRVFDDMETQVPLYCEQLAPGV